MPETDAVYAIARVLQGEAGMVGLPGVLACAWTIACRLALLEKCDAVVDDVAILDTLRFYYGDANPDITTQMVARVVVERPMSLIWMLEYVGMGEVADEPYYFCMSKQDRIEKGWPEGEVVIEGRNPKYAINLYSKFPGTEEEER